MKALSRLRWLPFLFAAAALACSLSIPRPASNATPAAQTSSTAASQPAVPLSSGAGKIAYANLHLSTWRILAFNPDGSDQDNLTPSLQGYSRPVWSPDGTRLGLRMEIGGTKDEGITEGLAMLEVQSAAGNLYTPEDPLTLTTNPVNSLAWAPDGRSLLYTSFLGPIGIAYQVDLSTHEMQALSNIPVNANDISWSPDGTRLLFANFTGSSANTQDVFVANADGSGLTDLTNTPDATEFTPVWSPDGTRIAYVSGSPNADGSYANADIFILNADGSGRFQLTTSPQNDFDPAWSPDGKRLAFATDRHAANDSNSEIYIINADGSGEMRLTNNQEADRSPSWRAALPEDTPPASMPPRLCHPALTLLRDVNIPPGTRFATPQVFTKIWRVQNSGDCPWTPTAFRLQPAEGDWAASPPVMVQGAIQPGAEADLAVLVTPPETPGLYSGDWVLVDGSGQPVPDEAGNIARLPIQIEVLAPGAARLPRPLYVLLHADGPLQLWRGEVDGRTITQLTDEAEDVKSFHVSADGHLAYVSGSDVILTGPGGGDRQVLWTGANFAAVAWSPDGRRLAYEGGGVRIHDMASGTDTLLLEDVLDPSDWTLYYPLEWSPDGNKLLVKIVKPEAAGSSVVTPATGSGMEIISAADGSLLASLNYLHFAWGNDPETLFITSGFVMAGEPTSVTLYSLSLKDGRREQIPVTGGVYFPIQAPDDSLYYFLQELSEDDELILTRSDVDGNGARPLLPQPFYIPNRSLVGINWTSGLDALAVMVHRPASGASDLMVYTLDGSPPLFITQAVAGFGWGP